MNNRFRAVATFIFLVCGIVVIVMTLILIVKERKRSHAIQDEIYTLEQEKEKYEHINIELQDKVAYLKSKHSYEKEAKKLNYKKQGEHVVIVRRSNKEQENEESVTKEQEQPQLKHHQIWLNYFFNKNI